MGNYRQMILIEGEEGLHTDLALIEGEEELQTDDTDRGREGITD